MKQPFTPKDILDAIDAECIELGLPPLSWLVVDIPGRPDSTPEQRAQVYKASEEGKYDLLYKKWDLT